MSNKAKSKPIRMTATEAKEFLEIISDLDDGNDAVSERQKEILNELQQQLELAANGDLPAPVIINIRADDEADDDDLSDGDDDSDTEQDHTRS